MKEYIVTNYRYGLPKGTVLSSDEIDSKKIRFLAPMKTKAKKNEE